MSQKILFFLSITSIICVVSSIYLQTKSYKNEYCMSKVIDSDDTIKISYLITGDSDEEKIDATLSDPNNQVVFSKKGESGADATHKAQTQGTYHLCFFVPQPGENYISFEFFTEGEKGHIVDMAKDQTLINLKDDVNRISSVFEDIEKNIRFIMDRRTKHTEVMHTIVNSIRNLSFFKIFLILLVSLIQIFLIKKFMGTNKIIGSNNPFFDVSGGI